MSKNPARKNKQLSTTVSPETYEALNDYRFENRVEKIGDILTQAVSEFLANHKVTVAPSEAKDTDAKA